MGLEVVTYTKQDGATTCDYWRHQFQMFFFFLPAVLPTEPRWATRHVPAQENQADAT